MSWQALKVLTDGETADRLSDALMEAGALSASIEDAQAGTDQEQPIFGEPGMPPQEPWQNSMVNALFDPEAPVEQILAETAAALNLTQTLPHKIEAVPEQDWVRLTQAQFDPIRISDRLWIVPTWHETPDASAINIVLDPGLAFGTGSHPTTQLCLRWLERTAPGARHLLDYGCGSGILAIAAAKLGAVDVVGVDIDPQAIQSARQNAAANQVTARFYLPDDFPGFVADVLVANILANPLKLLAPALAAHTAAGGQIALSGVLAHQADEVIAAYAPWFDLSVAGQLEEWVCLSGQKKAVA